MYLSFYSLKENPFNLVSDPGLFYYSESHCEALAQLLYALGERKGLTLLLGEAGTGKTMVLRTTLAMLRCTNVMPALILNPLVRRPEELLQLILQAYGVRTTGTGLGTLTEKLYRHLEGQNTLGVVPVLIVDEAQALNSVILEQIRLLTNFEGEGRKLLQVVLAGQPELAQRIDSAEMRALRQRIAVRCRLRPLNRLETPEYVRSRLERSSDSNRSIFTLAALDCIYRYSMGIPRIINNIADNCLLAGYARGFAQIHSPLVEEVSQHLELQPADNGGRQIAGVSEDLLRGATSWKEVAHRADRGTAPQEFAKFVDKLSTCPHAVSTEETTTVAGE